MTLFYIIRHGETDYNRNGRYQGQSDIPLNAEGRRQTQLLATRMKEVPLDVIYTSPLSRAQETARTIAAGRPVMLEPRLMEVSVGRAMGLTNAEIARDLPEFWAQMQREPDRTPFPGGENAYDVQKRAVEALWAVRERYPHERVAVVSHGGVIKALVCDVLGLSLAERHRIVLNNCSLTIVEWGAERRRLRSLNEMGHLGVEPGDIKADF
ncbi:MAG TPA: histidine phosphatase family protein [Symbiobacteriaceae bacterium]